MKKDKLKEDMKWIMKCVRNRKYKSYLELEKAYVRAIAWYGGHVFLRLPSLKTRQILYDASLKIREILEYNK